MTSISDFRSIEEYRQLLRMNRLFFKYPVEGIRRWGLARLLEIRSSQLCHDCGYRNTQDGEEPEHTL